MWKEREEEVTDKQGDWVKYSFNSAPRENMKDQVGDWLL